MTGMGIRSNNCIKLQDRKTVFAPLFHTIQHQFFSYVQSPTIGIDSITCITDMTAAANIIGMQNIESIYLLCSDLFSNSRVCLASEKVRSAFTV